MLGLWAAYLLTIPLQSLTLPWPAAIPIPELVGVVLVAAALLNRRRASFGPTLPDAAVGWWLGAVIVGAVMHRTGTAADSAAMREAAAAVALTSVYAAVRLSATRALLEAFPRLYIMAAALAAGLGIAGWLMAQAGIASSLAFPAATPYLYLGTTARAQALTPTPSMLASLLVVGIVLLVGEWERMPRRVRVPVALLLTIALVLTFSKAAIGLVAGVAIAALLRERTSPWRVRLAVGVCAAVMAVFSVAAHFALVTPAAQAAMEKGYMVAGDPLAEVTVGATTYRVMRTNYFYSKYASIEAIRQSFPDGIGPGQHGAFIRDLQSSGRYPLNLWEADPHSTYTGTIAELGLFGMLSLLTLWSLLGWRLWSMAPESMPSGAWASYAGILGAMAVEAICVDVMNFRHYWWYIAVVAAWSALAARPSLPDPNSSEPRRPSP